MPDGVRVESLNKDNLFCETNFSLKSRTTLENLLYANESSVEENRAIT